MPPARRQRADSAQRRAQIAEAALRVLGEHGPRGLTHRAVDAAARLPAGSVNYHAPTRQRLLDMATEELFAHDIRLATRTFQPSEPGPDAVDPVTELTEVAMHFVTESTAPQTRFRVFARHHLLAEARRNRELAAHFDTARTTFVHLVHRHLMSAEVNATPEAAELWVTLIDGLVHRQVFFPESALSAPRVRSLIATAVQALTAPEF